LAALIMQYVLLDNGARVTSRTTKKRNANNPIHLKSLKSVAVFD